MATEFTRPGERNSVAPSVGEASPAAGVGALSSQAYVSLPISGWRELIVVSLAASVALATARLLHVGRFTPKQVGTLA